MSLGMVMVLSSNSSCCDQAIESSDCSDSENEDDTKNCCGIICDCLCCGHIFTFNELKVDSQAAPSLISESIIEYAFDNYSYKFSSGVWQPPRLSKV